jgi:hypothetical protein
MFATVTGAFNENLKSYGMHGSMGKNIYVTTWLAVAFSLGAALFWMLSTCCCSGRSPYNHKNTPRGVTAEKTPYTYEPLGPQAHTTPYNNTSYPPPPPPAQNRTNAYEPFRHI